MYNTTEAKIFCLIAIKLKTKDLLINFVYIVTYRNQLKVAPLKNLLFLAVLKLDNLKYMLANVYINKIHARQCLYIYI